MSSIKKKATKKPLKHPHTSLDLFQNDSANMAFNDHYKRAPIILERTVDLESPYRALSFQKCSKKEHGRSCWIQWAMYIKMSLRILHQCHCGRKSHQLLAKRERVLNLKGIDSRDFGDSSNDSSHISTIWWEKGETRTPHGIPWWTTQQEGLAHHYVHLENANFGLHHDLQPLPGEKLEELVCTEDHFPIWSLHSQGDRHLQSHLLPLHQKHHKKEFKANSTIPKPCHVSYFKGKGEDSKWTSSNAKRRSY